MKVFVLLALAAAASAKSLQVKDLEYGFCPGAAEVLSFDALSVTPYPIHVHSGSDITLHVLLTLKEVIPVGATVKVKMVREGLIDIGLPCLNIGEVSIGSCDYSGQEILDFGADFLCPTYFPEGQDCVLPLNPGQYGGEPVTLTFGDLPDLLVDILATGHYSATANVYLADGSEMTCLELHADLG